MLALQPTELELEEDQVATLSGIAKFWIVAFPITSYFFYRYVGVSDQIFKLIYFTALPATVLYSLSAIFGDVRYTRYSGILRNIFVLLVLSMLSAYLFWGQDFSVSYRVVAVYLAIVYFFFLIKERPDLGFIEKVLWFFCIHYVLLWMYGVYKAPELVFGLDRDGQVSDERGFFRLFIPGKTIIVLGYFMALNKYNDSKKIKWIGVAALLFAVIVMHVIRQVIAISLIVGVLYVIRENKNKLLFGFIALVGFMIASNLEPAEDSVLGKLVTMSEEQIERNQTEEEDIRVQEYRYFFTSYSRNIATVILGNGFAHTEGPFGAMEWKLGQEKYFFASDVGYAEIFIRLGLVGLLSYCLLFYKVVRQRVPARYMYAKLYMVYLIFANVAASWVFHDTIIICFCLYILEYCYQKEQNSNITQATNEVYDRNSRV
jgi:hypothetical protein